MASKTPLIRRGTQPARILSALRRGPLSGAQIGELIDEITPYVARTMAKMRERGLVVNMKPGSNAALYAITDNGRDALNNVEA